MYQNEGEKYIPSTFSSSDFDQTEIVNNIISGKAYYGLQINGSRNRNEIDLSSDNNVFTNNNLEKLLIKSPDEYSDNHVDGYTFTGSDNKATTAHVWINNRSKNNSIKLKKDESVIDEGIENKIVFLD